MSTMYSEKQTQWAQLDSGDFDLDATLSAHSWCSFMNLKEAEEALLGKPQFTYLLRPNDKGRGFAITFVNDKGELEHNHFKLINPTYGIFRQGAAFHVGRLERVICDMMDCSAEKLKPLR